MKRYYWRGCFAEQGFVWLLLTAVIIIITTVGIVELMLLLSLLSSSSSSFLFLYQSWIFIVCECICACAYYIFQFCLVRASQKDKERMGLWLLPLPLIHYLCIVNTPCQFRFIYGMDKFSRALQLLHMYSAKRIVYAHAYIQKVRISHWCIQTRGEWYEEKGSFEGNDFSVCATYVNGEEEMG